MVLNYLASREGLEYDKDGSIAASGNNVDSLARSLESWSYLSRRPPKSLGFEQVSEELFPLLDPGIPRADLLHTFSNHIAATVAHSCIRKGTLLITGGGAHNTYLRQLIAEKAKGVEVVYPEKQLVDFKEALVFAFLGALWQQQKPNVLSSVTGAEFDHVGGRSIG
jgi:anhydro-N-acetylmuramic acid kinase